MSLEKNIFNEQDFLNDIETYKSIILTNIKILIDEHNLSLSKNSYTNKVYIDGICEIQLYNNISIYNSSYKNILFLNDMHKFDNTKRNIYFKRYDLYLSVILFIKNLIQKYKEIYDIDNIKLNELSIKSIRLLIIFINKNFYEIITENLYNNEIISIDELLYYNSNNFNECFDIFIENDRFDILDIETVRSNTFLYLSDLIFFNCGDKLFYDKEDKIINDPYSESLNKVTSICNFNIRYHRADIRNNYDNGRNDIAYKKNTQSKGFNIVDYDEFNKLIEDYIDYIFYEGDKIDTLFYNKHLNENITFYSETKLKELRKFFEISSNNIKKQFDKSIFKKNLSINNLKKIIIDTENEDDKFNITTEIYDTLTFNDIPNMRLFSITMNLYSIFRIFIENWENKNRNNLSDDCNKLNYPKNIIYFSGGAHIKWIILFINNIKLFNNESILTEDLVISNNENYVELNIFDYLKLKEFFFNKDERKIFNHSKQEYELYLKYSDINLANLENIDYIEFYSYYNIFIDIILYYSNKSFDNLTIYSDINSYLIKIATYINNQNNLEEDDINSDLNYLNEYYNIHLNKLLNYISNLYLINQLKYITIYFNLLKKYIFNTIIVLKYNINIIHKIYFRTNKNYDIDMDIDIYNLYYNKEDLSYLIKNIDIIIDNVNKYLLNINLFVNINYYKFLNKEYNRIIKKDYILKDKIKDFLIKDIILKFDYLNKIIEGIESYKSILYTEKYYKYNLLIFLNNTIIMLCYYYNNITKSNNSSKLNIKCKSDMLNINIDDLIINYKSNNIIN
jgi:hypothetical protein